MPQAAIYVRDPLPSPGNILSGNDQKTACRGYCQAPELTITARFRDDAGARDEFTRMITQDDSTSSTSSSGSSTASPGPSRRPLSCETNPDELAPAWSPPRRKESTINRPCTTGRPAVEPLA